MLAATRPPSWAACGATSPRPPSLAGRLRCVRSNVTQLVDRLEADGLVKRGTCSEDRRAIRAKLTPLGQERHAAGVRAIRAVQQEIVDRTDAAQRAELVRLMRLALG